MKCKRCNETGFIPEELTYGMCEDCLDNFQRQDLEDQMEEVLK